eukprot:3579261-Pleurochrysis_carterae.AAC.3
MTDVLLRLRATWRRSPPRSFWLSLLQQACPKPAHSELVELAESPHGQCTSAIAFMTCLVAIGTLKIQYMWILGPRSHHLACAVWLGEDQDALREAAEGKARSKHKYLRSRDLALARAHTVTASLRGLNVLVARPYAAN